MIQVHGCEYCTPLAPQSLRFSPSTGLFRDRGNQQQRARPAALRQGDGLSSLYVSTEDSHLSLASIGVVESVVRLGPSGNLGRHGLGRGCKQSCPLLGCYGDPYVRTPVLDKLAAGGVRFERAYVPQSGCSQSRAAFLSGTYPHQNGQIGLATWKFRMYREDTPNIVRSLKQEGYRTGIIGKLHVNPESAFPFDYKRIPSSNFGRKRIGQYAEAAHEFLTASNQPFFLSVNYPDPHRPFLASAGGLPKRLLTAEEVKPLPYIGIDSPELRADTANYYNCMSRLDSLIGDLLASLARSGKADNTVIVYFGDHGADMLRGKRTSCEGGSPITLLPRVSAGSLTSACCPGHLRAKAGRGRPCP